MQGVLSVEDVTSCPGGGARMFDRVCNVDGRMHHGNQYALYIRASPVKTWLLAGRLALHITSKAACTMRSTIKTYMQ